MSRGERLSKILLPTFSITPPAMKRLTNDTLLLRLEVVENDGALGRLLTPVLDDDTRAVDDLTRVALTVQDTWEK
jgi:hypothetical protein